MKKDIQVKVTKEEVIDVLEVFKGHCDKVIEDAIAGHTVNPNREYAIVIQELKRDKAAFDYAIKRVEGRWSRIWKKIRRKKNG